MRHISKIFLLAAMFAVGISSCRLPIDPDDPTGGKGGKGGKGGGENREGQIVLLTQYMEFGHLNPGNIASINALFEVKGGISGVISSVQVEGAGFSVTHPDLPFIYNMASSQAMEPVVVSFTAPAEPGEYYGTLVINGNQYAKLHATVGGKPEGGRILVEATDLMFDNVKLGESTTGMAYIINNSREPIVVTAASMDGMDVNNFSFSAAANTGIVPFPFTVAPGQKFPVSITFTPSETNRKYWTGIKFHIQSNLNPAQIDNITNVTGVCY